MPAVVKEYDSSARTVAVQPQLQRGIPDAKGDWQMETLPLLYDVPVVMPACGGFEIVFPVRVGDTVLLVFHDRDITTWRHTGDVSDPGDQRAHHVAGAVAILGLFPDSGMSNAAGGYMSIGAKGGLVTSLTPSQMQVGGNTYGVSRADLVQTMGNQLKTAIALAQTSIVPMDGGAAFVTALLSALSTWPSSTACARVAVDS